MFIFSKADVDIPDGAFTLLDWFILTIGRKTFTTFGGNQKFILKVLFLVRVSLQNVGKFHLFHQFHLDSWIRWIRQHPILPTTTPMFIYRKFGII